MKLRKNWKFEIKNAANLNYMVFLIIISMYFVPKYLEFTTFYYYDWVKKMVFIFKNLSYALAMMWFLIRIIRTIITKNTLKKIKKRKINVNLLVAICLIGVYLSYQAFFKDVKAIFVVFLLSLIFDEQYLEKYIKYIFNCSCILYVFTIVSCKIGIIENAITERHKFGGIWTAGGNGFEYSGQMIMMLIPIVFMYYFLKKNKISMLDNLLWTCISIVVFSQCKTIMGLLLIFIFIIAFNIIFKWKCSWIWIIKSKIMRMIPVISCMLISFLELLYRKGIPFMTAIDGLLNGRLSVTSRVIDGYGITLFGTIFENNTLDGRYEIIDSEYLYYAIKAGVLYLIVSLILGVLIIRYVQKKKDVCLTLIFSMVFINAIINNGIWGIVMNPFSILLVPAIKDYFEVKKKGDIGFLN